MDFVSTDLAQRGSPRPMLSKISFNLKPLKASGDVLWLPPEALLFHKMPPKALLSPAETMCFLPWPWCA